MGTRNATNGGRRSAVMEPLELRQLMSAGGPPADAAADLGVVLPLGSYLIGTPQGRDLTYTAANGSTVTVTVRGGTASLTLPAGETPTLRGGHYTLPADQGTSPGSVSVTDAKGSRATLTFTAKGGQGTFDVDQVTGGDLAAVVAPRGSLGNSLTAASLGRLTVGAVAANGQVVVAGSVGTVTVAGTFGGTLTAARLASLSAQALSGAKVITTGDIGRVTAGDIDGTIITAGVTPTTRSDGTTVYLPSSASGLATAATIGSVRSPQTRGLGISAAHVGRLSLGTVVTSREASETVGPVTVKAIGFTLPVIGGPAFAPFTVGPAGSTAVLRAELTRAGVAYATSAADPASTDTAAFGFNLFAG